MPDTKDNGQPRTYKVTRGQMKEIVDTLNGATETVYNIMANNFGLFDDESNISNSDIEHLLSLSKEPDLIKSIFPSYFYIPEGEPILVRDGPEEEWVIRISDGKGRAHGEGYITNQVGDVAYKQIIPFTKNPPK